MSNYEKLNIRPDTKKLVENCVLLYLKHHPEMQHIKISQDKIIFEMAKFYLK